MKYLRIINQRIIITSALILAQITWFVVFLIKLTDYSASISTAFTLLSLLIILYIIKKDDNSAYKIGWIILIMLMPLFGGLFYLFFGNKTPTKSMQLQIRKEAKRISVLLAPNDELLQEIGGFNERVMGTCRYLQVNNSYPIYKNTSSKYYPLGDLMYQDMLIDLEKAEKFIYLEYFIIEEGVMWDGIVSILRQKAAQGVDVRIIYDDFGSLFLLPTNFRKKLRKEGINCIAFNEFRPFLSLVMNNRDHRKILVIDGHTAYNGGINLADEYINKIQKFGHWKDSGIRLQGDAVWSFTLMFLEIWNSFHRAKDSYDHLVPPSKLSQSETSDGYVQPFSDSPFDEETTGENVYIDLLAQAKHYVYIFTPYLIIDSEMNTALCMAAKRGVDIRIVTPGIPDKKIVYQLTRSHYEPLIKAGVQIYEYTPGFIHAKSYVCDDECAVVGTINMDFRSLYLHFECGTFLYHTKSIEDLKRDALDTIHVSREITLADCKRGFFTSLFDAVLRVLAPLF